MTVAGIDVSTKKIAVVVLFANGRYLDFEIISKKDNASDRFIDLATGFYSFMGNKQVDIVVVETVPFVQNVKTALGLAGVEGAVRTVCALYDIRCEQINNSTWKKALGIGKGKDGIAEYVTRLGYNMISQDVMDAYCIASAWKVLHDN